VFFVPYHEPDSSQLQSGCSLWVGGCAALYHTHASVVCSIRALPMHEMSVLRGSAF